MHIGRAPWITCSDPHEIRGTFKLNSKRAPQCCFAEHILRFLVKILQFEIVYLLGNIKNSCRKLTFFLLYIPNPLIKKLFFFPQEEKSSLCENFQICLQIPLLMTFENLIHHLGHVARIDNSNSLTSVLFQSREGGGRFGRKYYCHVGVSEMSCLLANILPLQW